MKFATAANRFESPPPNIPKASEVLDRVVQFGGRYFQTGLTTGLIAPVYLASVEKVLTNLSYKVTFQRISKDLYSRGLRAAVPGIEVSVLLYPLVLTFRAHILAKLDKLDLDPVSKAAAATVVTTFLGTPLTRWINATIKNRELGPIAVLREISKGGLASWYRGVVSSAMRTSIDHIAYYLALELEKLALRHFKIDPLALSEQERILKVTITTAVTSLFIAVVTNPSNVMRIRTQSSLDPTHKAPNVLTLFKQHDLRFFGRGLVASFAIQFGGLFWFFWIREFS